MAEIKDLESYLNAEASVIVATTQIQLEEPEESEVEEHLFHSHMWVKGMPLHFFVDNGSQNNLISAEVVKILELPTTTHLQTYNTDWLSQG